MDSVLPREPQQGTVVTNGDSGLRGGLGAPPWQVPAILLSAAFVVLVLWLFPIQSSLWLDETVTAWVISGSLEQTLARGSEFSGSHPFFYAIQWAFVQVLGSSEFALRLPSLLGMLGAAGFLFAIGRRWVDKEAGAIAVVLFVGNSMIQFHARDARTYAMGLFFILGSTWYLMEWTKAWRWRDGILLAIFGACIFHIHFVLSLHWGVLAFILGLRLIEGGPRPIGKILAVIALGALCVAPGIPYFIELNSRWRGLVVVDKPDYDILLRALSCYRTLGIVLIASMMAMVLWRVRLNQGLRETLIRRTRVAELLVWYLAAPMAIFLLSRYTSMRLFIPRYFIGFVPAFSLLVALGIRQIRPSTARLAMMVAIALALVVTQRSLRHHPDDWVLASRHINRLVEAHGELPVFFRSGLVEAKNLEWLEGGDRKAYLDAPLLTYPIKSSRIVTLPYALLTKEEYAYMDQLVKRFSQERGIILVSRESSREFNFWLTGRLMAEGFQAPIRRSKDARLTVDLYLRN